MVEKGAERLPTLLHESSAYLTRRAQSASTSSSTSKVSRGIALLAICIALSIGSNVWMVGKGFSVTPKQKLAQQQGVTSVPRLIFLEGTENSTFEQRGINSTESRSLDYSEMTWVYDPALDEQYENATVNEKLMSDDPHCKPMAVWQENVRPNCNTFHATSLLQDLMDSQISMLEGGGNSRNAWKRRDILPGQRTLWKIMNKKHVIENEKPYRRGDKSQIEAVAMERLMSSPGTVDIFGFCGTSLINAFAEHSLLTFIKGKSPREKLMIAIDISKAVVDIHTIDDVNVPSLAQGDLHYDNIRVTSDNRVVISDDDSVKLLKRHNETGETCPYMSPRKDSPWVPHEIFRDLRTPKPVLVDKVDIYALGNFFYLFAVGAGPWDIDKKHYKQRRERGEPRFIPDHILVSTDPSIKTLVQAQRSCNRFDPMERPSAAQVVAILQETLNTTWTAS